MFAESCNCSASGPCLSIHPDKLVLAASQHSTNAGHIIGIGRKKIFDYSVFSPYEFLASASLIRNGFQCRFRTNNSWEPTVVQNWTEPFNRNAFSFTNPRRFLAKYCIINVFGTPESIVHAKEIELKLTTSMLTTIGFTSLQFGSETLQPTSLPRKFYVGVSGGGWRALTGHMGAFRALSNNNLLPMVDMFSSVSGGTWFLTKLAFDDEFSAKVLRNDMHISESVLEWMERDYFPVIRNATRLHQKKQSSNDNVASFLTTLVTQAPGPVRAALSSGIVAANHFHFSWQELVEQAVLGQGIVSHKPLANTNLAQEARANFGNATLAFNWNQLHQWESPSTCSKWFLKEAQGEYVQYPVYTSALYEERSDDDIRYEVIMQGKSMNGSFRVCLQEKESFCENGISSTSNNDVMANCGDFQFRNLTVGQVASASSAAVGGGAVRAWVQSVIELIRQKAKDTLKGSVNVLYCSQYGMLIKNLLGSCHQQLVLEEFFKFLGCETDSLQKEDSEITAKRWVGFLKKMAVQMNVSSPLANDHQGHMAIDAVRSTQTTYAYFLSKL